MTKFEISPRVGKNGLEIGIRSYWGLDSVKSSDQKGNKK
jgi:hypothetical protein